MIQCSPQKASTTPTSTNWQKSLRPPQNPRFVVCKPSKRDHLDWAVEVLIQSIVFRYFLGYGGPGEGPRTFWLLQNFHVIMYCAENNQNYRNWYIANKAILNYFCYQSTLQYCTVQNYAVLGETWSATGHSEESILLRASSCEPPSAITYSTTSGQKA